MYRLLYFMSKFLTTLRSHLDVTCSCYFWSSLLTLSVGHRLCIDFSVSRANFLTSLNSNSDITCSCYFWTTLLTLSVGLCLDFSLSRANFLTTLRSQLDVMCSFFWSNLFNVDVKYSYIYKVNYSCSLKCIEKKSN